MILCFDIGGSWIKSAVATSAADLRPLGRQQTPPDNYAHFCGLIAAEARALDPAPRCVAISMTGVVDPETGLITCANIPCVDQKPLQADLEELLGLPVLIANDADCFVLAEAFAGAGKGHHIVFGIILGSGVGGGLVVGGRLVNRAGGYAGEWGHGPSVAACGGTPPAAIPEYACGCGQSRCLNTVGGARGLERLHAHLHGNALASHDIIAAWEAGERDAARTIDVYVDLVASPLAVAVNITGANIVPVGGGLSNSHALITKIDETVRTRILGRLGRPLVVKAGCDLEPGLMGAALLGLDLDGYGGNSAGSLRR